jgi:N-acetylglucosaminyl-diphospho-decaprenol L-rhamnosyltransferase
VTSSRTLTITIVNHNHWLWLQDCLASIATHPYTLGPSKIIVIDNASEDGSREGLRDEFPNVVVIQTSTRRGFGANQNDAVTSSTTDLVFIMNPDAVVHESTLDLLAEAFNADGSIAIAACPDTGSDHSLPVDGPLPFPTPSTALERAVRISRHSSEDLVDKDGRVADGWVSGHAFMIDRQRFVDSGGFDTSYFMYSEEVDLMFRMQRDGWRIAWVEEALTTHVGKTSDSPSGSDSDKSSGVIPSRTIVQFARSEIKYIHKNQGPAMSVAFRASSALDAAIRYCATWISPIRRTMVPKGPTIEHTRLYHLTRLRVFLGNTSLPDMEDSAAEWNRLNAPSDRG